MSLPSSLFSRFPLRDKLAPLLDRFTGRRRMIFVPLALLLLLAVAWACGRGIFSSVQFSSSGIILTDEDIVASEIAGRVVELMADEGDGVQAGQPLAQLDSVFLAAQVEQADAALAMAQANLAKLEIGARPEEIAQAQAGLAQSIARRDGAKNALADALAQRSTPQNLNLRINAARANGQAMEHRALAANFIAQGATLERQYFERTVGELEGGITIQTPFGVVTRTVGSARLDDLRQQAAAAAAKEWSAWAAQSAAFAQRDGARAELDNLLAQQTNPLTLNVPVDKARADLDAAQAAVSIAQAKLDALTAGTRSENIAAAKGQVAQAQGARDSLQAQLNKMTLTAPRTGIIAQRLLHLGEMAAPGNAVYHIVNLDEVTLTVYVPEDQIGHIRVGARADVTVDSFPGRAFVGTVSFVSPQAEFTPKNIATKDQRVTQVFAVKITIANADHSLKTGMPADAVIY